MIGSSLKNGVVDNLRILVALRKAVCCLGFTSLPPPGTSFSEVPLLPASARTRNRCECTWGA